mmetsp:Transcript_53800/g.116292  ORF Transcript_53800/g.116292 Transcript_53800/m.116292 type:complete len:205 (+) Transcript_53800:1302-1916(+)
MCWIVRDHSSRVIVLNNDAGAAVAVCAGDLGVVALTEFPFATLCLRIATVTSLREHRHHSSCKLRLLQLGGHMVHEPHHCLVAMAITMHLPEVRVVDQERIRLPPVLMVGIQGCQVQAAAVRDLRIDGVELVMRMTVEHGLKALQLLGSPLTARPRVRKHLHEVTIERDAHRLEVRALPGRARHSSPRTRKVSRIQGRSCHHSS